jgi:hypothetical protein
MLQASQNDSVIVVNIKGAATLATTPMKLNLYIMLLYGIKHNPIVGSLLVDHDPWLIYLG